MQFPKNNLPDDKDKLRRWVSNLQLESWQLELLITGFSIFLLATSLDEYDSFRRAIQYNKISPSSDSSNPFLSISVITLINTIPWALRFFLINLLIHLLLRGFWIGIVGLSSVSSEIHYDKLKLRGKFRKAIPERVKSLDQLIVYLDNMSSVIFAYTYLLVFSIISVMLVFVILIALFGIIFWLMALASQSVVFVILGVLVAVLVLLIALGAILFFIDTLTFSRLKRSKWFSAIFYPIYRVFSVLTLSFLYRSIYYHLITNYKKKQIIFVTLGMLGLFYVSQLFAGWDNYNHFPETYGTSEHVLENEFYDDSRGDQYIGTLSIPSKFVDDNYLQLFIRYRPSQNAVMSFLCPSTINMNSNRTVMDGFNAGIESQRDSTVTLSDLLGSDAEYADALEQSVKCLSQIYEVSIDGVLQENLEYSYYIHPSKREKGFFVMIDLKGAGRKKHVLEVRLLASTGPMMLQKIKEEELEMRSIAKLPFWIK